MAADKTVFPSKEKNQSRWRICGAATLLIVIAAVAYHNSFSGPFIYDDVSAIPDNPTIRHLWPVWDVLAPPSDSGVTVNGRPILNLTLAINYAISGTDVAAYHATNFAIHALAGLVLFGLIRRTLLTPSLRQRFGAHSLTIAWIASAIWIAHPIQTESVTYIVQRAESLVGLFYLLTLYCVARQIEHPTVNSWSIAAFFACLLGMASKEVMVSAPLIALLYDRTFGAGLISHALRTRWRLYCSLAATWLLLAVLVIHTGGRGGTAGFGAGGIHWWQYSFTQCRAIVRYLEILIWPQNLVFDYGDFVDKQLLAITPQAVCVCAVVALTVIGLVRRHVLGFIGVTFLAILAPSSSFVPVATETLAEHRMYLASAPLVAALTAGLVFFFGRSFWRLGICAAAALCLLTINRNQVYQSAFLLWSDTINKWDKNSRAQNNLGEIYFKQGKLDDAIKHFVEAIRQVPNYIDALNNLGITLIQAKRPNEALEPLQLALRLKPDYAPTHTNLGNDFYVLERYDEAIAQFRTAISLKPNYHEAHHNLGLILAKQGHADEAIMHYRRAIEIRPQYEDAHFDLGNILADLGKTTEAIAEFQEALRLKPNWPEALNNLGRVRYIVGQDAAALANFEAALRLRPDYADAHNNYAIALVRANRASEAVAHLRKALELNPQFLDAQKNLDILLQSQH